MSTQQINIRIDEHLVAALDRVAREESLDRATTIRRLLERSVRTWEVEHAVLDVLRGDASAGRAAEDSGLSNWELIDALRVAGVSNPLSADDIDDRVTLLDGRPARDTLPDRPPREGGVLLVGINPAPVSVAAGHYYQGRLGRRLWRRLERLGLLQEGEAGREDDAFVAAGNGLTDVVKRPTTSADQLVASERVAGARELRAKIRAWKPGLVLFAFKSAASELLGDASPGPCGEIEGVPAFLLSGPYASAGETRAIDRRFRELRGENAPTADAESSQTVTVKDLEAGRIRLKQTVRRLFPDGRGTVDIVVRGERISAIYDPRVGPDRSRSPVLQIGPDRLGSLVMAGEVLAVRRGRGGVPTLD